jgi:predicted RNase H-like nuclease (RuvC/YqgF family)
MRGGTNNDDNGSERTRDWSPYERSGNSSGPSPSKIGSCESMKDLYQIFSEQKQKVINQQIQIKYYQNEIKNSEMKIQSLLKHNNNLTKLAEESDEKIDINEEMKENLEKEFDELYSSKSNMMLTLQAINSKIDEVSKKTTEEVVRLHQMIEEVTMKIEEVKKIQLKERGKSIPFPLIH